MVEICINTTTICENDIRFFTEQIGKEYTHCSRNEKGLVVLHFKEEDGCKKDCGICPFDFFERNRHICKYKNVLMGATPYYTNEKTKTRRINGKIQKQTTLF